MKKILAMALALVLALTCFAGCAGTATSSSAAPSTSATSTAEEVLPTGEVTIWVWTDLAHLWAAYEADHPDTKVNQVVVAAGDYVSKVQTTVASGGKLPDILLAEISNRGQLFNMDIFEDLSAEPYNFDINTIDPSVHQTMMDADGRILGIEAAVNPAGLAYQRDLTEEYFGVSEPEDVTALLNGDWDKFIELGKQVVADSDGSVYMIASLGELYYMLNGQMDTPRISGEVIDTAAVLELFENICKFRDAGVVSKIEQWTPAWFSSFGTQDAVFAAMPAFGCENWIEPNYESGEANWGLIVPPEGGVNWGGTSWGVTKGSENKALAWDVVDWYMSADGGAPLQFEDNYTVSAADFYTDERVDNNNNPFFAGQPTLKVYMQEILPTISSTIPTIYDFADICTIETVLSALNADYNMAAQEAADLYVSEMQRQAPELTTA